MPNLTLIIGQIVAPEKPRSLWLRYGLALLLRAGLLYGWRRPGAPTQVFADPEPGDDPETQRNANDPADESHH
jgi:hypothetical protein